MTTLRTRTSGIVALVAAGAVALSGCAAMEDVARSPEKENTRRGAGYGAAAGAVTAALIRVGRQRFSGSFTSSPITNAPAIPRSATGLVTSPQKTTAIETRAR